MAPTTHTAETTALAKQFQALAEEWRSAVALLSSSTAMRAHPAYQAIIALGPAVVPLLLQELQRDRAHWFDALSAITGDDPVRREDWGKVTVMAGAWLAWGRNRGLV